MAELPVRQTIYRWNKSGLSGLWDASGRGKKATWTDKDWNDEYVSNKFQPLIFEKALYEHIETKCSI